MDFGKTLIIEYNFINTDVNSFFYRYFKTEFIQIFIFFMIYHLFLILRKYFIKKYYNYNKLFIITIPKFFIFQKENVDIFIFFSDIFMFAYSIKIIANGLMFLLRV